MKTIQLYWVLVLIVNCFFCKAQSDIEIAFSIERDSIKVNLPDSLKGGDNQGIAIVKVYVDQDYLIYKMDIKKLTISSNNQTEKLTYTNTSSTPIPFEDYPLSIQRFYSFLEDYVKSIKIIPKKKAETNVLDQAILLVKLI